MDPAVSKRKFEREIESLRCQASGFVESAGWEVLEATYPILAVVFPHPRTQRRVGFRFSADDWDEIPPSLVLFDPGSGDELSWLNWPKGGWSAHESHPGTHKPFLCLPGIREYHTHGSHLGDRWDNLRGRESYRLRYIIHRVQQRFGATDG
jgi:hypothetical protein